MRTKAMLTTCTNSVDVHFFEQEEIREKGGLCLAAFQMLLLALSARMSAKSSAAASSLSALYVSAIGMHSSRDHYLRHCFLTDHTFLVVAILSIAGAYYLPGYLITHDVPVAPHCQGAVVVH